MKIVGHGIDLVNIAEMQRWIDDPRDPLIHRCFVEEELDEVGNGPNRVECLAGRFAAKEAVLKALGTGLGGGVGFSNVVIHRAPNATLRVRLTGEAAKTEVVLGITEWRLSISHAGIIAMANAIAIGTESHGVGL